MQHDAKKYSKIRQKRFHFVRSTAGTDENVISIYFSRNVLQYSYKLLQRN